METSVEARGKDDCRTSLARMPSETGGVVVEIAGSKALAARLDAIGIRLGARIHKTAGFRLRGPVTLRVGRSHIAVGFGMASKIIIEVVAEGKP